MPKKRAEKMKGQFSFRCTEALYNRVELVARAMGVDASDVIRMLLSEHLIALEERFKLTTDQGAQEPKKTR